MPDLVEIRSPSGAKFTVAKSAADAFTGFLSDLEAGGYKVAQGSGYSPRNIAGTNTPSQHAFGLAIDVNPQQNPQGANRPSDMPANVGDIAAKHGLTWGGNWSGSTRDPMHFEYGRPGGPKMAAATAPSADDLLKQMQTLTAGGGQPAPAAAPSADDLLKQMQSLAPPAAETPPPAAGAKTPDPADQPPAETPSVDDYGRPMPSPQKVTAPPSKEDVVNWLKGAPNTEYGNILPIARDLTTGEMRLALPHILRDPLVGLAEGPVEGATINPETGTLGVTPEAMAAGQLGQSGLRFSGPNPLKFVPPGTLERPPIPPGQAANMLNPNAATRIAEAQGAPVGVPPPAVETPFHPSAPGEAAPTSSTGVPVSPPQAAPVQPSAPMPQSAGAAVTPPAQAAQAMTPGQRIANLEKSVQQTAEERAGPRMQDDTAYVPNIPPRTLAARDFSQSVNALDEKVAYAKDTEFRDAVDANNRARNEGMVDLLRKDAGDSISLEKAHEARSEVSPSELGVFKNEQPTDASGLLAKVDELLAGPDRKRGAIRTVLNDVRDSLFDSNGKLESAPSQIYGARKNITDMLQKGVKGVGEQADNIRAAKSILTGLLPEVDATISAGAPKFSDYLKQWHDLSIPINQMEFLQRYQTGPRKLTDASGYLQPNKVQKMLDDVLQENKAPGPRLGKTLTPEHIANIEAVRNELAADQLKSRLARVPGSDTFQQFNRPGVLGRGPIGAAIKSAGELAIGVPSLGTANLLYRQAIKPGLEARRLARIARKESERKAELLAPPNPLQSP